VRPLGGARGAGAGSQNAIGFAVMGGMISATVLAILFVPVFFVLIARRGRPPAAPGALEAQAEADARAEEEERKRTATAAREAAHA
jgi:hypothetical protein